MRMPLLFPGKPKKPLLQVHTLVSTKELPSGFVEDTNQLLKDREVYVVAHGVGQLCRFAPYLLSETESMQVERQIKQWAEDLPPFWKSQIINDFLYELDEVVGGFTALARTAMPEALEQEQATLALLLRRDGLESVARVSHLLEGPYLEFELLRMDEKMAASYRERKLWQERLRRPPNSTWPERLTWTQRYYPSAWWLP